MNKQEDFSVLIYDLTELEYPIIEAASYSLPHQTVAVRHLVDLATLPLYAGCAGKVINDLIDAYPYLDRFDVDTADIYEVRGTEIGHLNYLDALIKMLIECLPNVDPGLDQEFYYPNTVETVKSYAAALGHEDRMKPLYRVIFAEGSHYREKAVQAWRDHYDQD